MLPAVAFNPSTQPMTAHLTSVRCTVAHSRPVSLVLTVASSALLAACSPKYDWREVHDGDASYTVLMPAKPDTVTREINLGGIRTSMKMTGAEIDGATFAVGTAKLPDAQQALAALPLMRSTMVNNISGTIREKKPDAQASKQAESGTTTMDVEAVGNAGGQSRILHGRFVARDARVYQAIVVGPENALPDDAVETFLSSFEVN
jgi:hypothetical protein